jgi:predicted nucleic acid-binding protein
MKLFLDTNILLDLLLDREPHADAAVRILSAVEAGKATGYIAGITLPNVHYILRDLHKRRDPRPVLESLLGFLEVVPTSKKILQEALVSGFKDYEDGIQHASAVAARCTHLVTRNTRDFRNSRMVVATASEMAALLRT